jgi:hypothetical protein
MAFDPDLIWTFMDRTESQLGVRLPAALRGQFAALDRRLWKAESGLALCSAALGLLVSYLALFVSDRLWDTPVWLRVVLMAAGMAWVGWAGYRWAVRWVFKRRDIRALSRLVQLRYRRLGDRLLGIVELANEEKRPPGFSAALYRAAIDQVSAEATEFSFPAAVDVRPVRRGLRLAVVAGGLVVGAVVVVPGAARNVFHRWVSPMASVERYTLVRIEALAAKQIVPHGEPFQVVASVSYRSFWHPGKAVADYGDMVPVEGVITDGQLRFDIPGQMRSGPLRIRLGDAAEELLIVPEHRPSLKEMTATVALPEYLKHPDYTESVKNGSVTVLEGSRVGFSGLVSRELKRAWLTSSEGAEESLHVSGEQFAVEAMVPRGVVHRTLFWEDVLGLTNAVPWELVVGTEQDFPPVAELNEFSRELAVLETEVLEVKAGARDDYGVREVGVAWRRVNGPDGSVPTASPAFRLEAASSQEKRLEERFYFNPSLLGIPADSSVEVRGYALDFFPGREPVYSPGYRIIVMGTEQHAEMIRQKLESMLVRLEEVTRLEEKIASSLKDLKELTNEELAEAKGTEALEEALEEQARNAVDLDQLSKEGLEAVREGMRNPTLPSDKLQEWAKNVQDMQKLSEGKMQQAAKSLKSAQNNQESKQENVASAEENAEEALQELQEMQESFNQGLDDLQALTLAQRLRKVATEEKEIEGRLEKQIAETIGLKVDEVPERYRKVNADLAEDQLGTQKDSEELKGEISRFYERTQQANYGQVTREMAEASLSEKLDAVGGLIAENISMQAMDDLSEWSERFIAWAEILEPKSEGSGGGGGGGGGGGDEEDPRAELLLKQLMALLRMREGQVNVRARTSLVEQGRGDAPVYQESVETLYSEQRTLVKRLIQLQMDNVIAPLTEPFKDIYGPMRDSAMLLGQPRTDRATQQAETRTIEVISDVINLINEQSKQGQSSKSQAASEQMAFLMQMMSPKPGEGEGTSASPTPGGNPGGGSTDQASAAAEGNSAGKEAQAKDVGKASGTVLQSVPTEFREALEDYFNAIEKTRN